MKRFLDTTVLIEACLAASPHFKAADARLRAKGSVTSAHALAEAYATLSGDPRLRIDPHDAARMVEDIATRVEVVGLAPGSYRKLIRQSPALGIRGGSVFDAIHAQSAREHGCREIHTLNTRHFRHVAPDLEIHGLAEQGREQRP